MSPSGGATARGWSGGTKEAEGIDPGWLRLGLATLPTTCDGSEKLITISFPSALTEAFPRGMPGKGSISRTKRFAPPVKTTL
jgi:hypothetical protein